MQHRCLVINDPVESPRNFCHKTLLWSREANEANFSTDVSQHQHNRVLQTYLTGCVELNKKSELMLMKCERAYSSSCSQVILVYLHLLCCNSFFLKLKITKNY